MTQKNSIKTQWVLVTAVSTFRMRYMVEVPVGQADHALDTVTMNEAREFDQEWLGETIVDHRVLDETQALDLFRSENGDFATWDDETIMQNHFTMWVKE